MAFRKDDLLAQEPHRIRWVSWTWHSTAEVEEDLRAFSGFEGLYFEVGPPCNEKH